MSSLIYYGIGYAHTFTNVIEHQHVIYASSYDGASGWGEFLQVSGLRVTYNVSLPAHHRVTDVQVLCAACDVPSYGPLLTNTTYRVLMSSFLNTGGDGFEMLRKPSVETLPGDEKDATEALLRQLAVVYPSVERRITIHGEPSGAQALMALSWVMLVAAVTTSWLGAGWRS